MRMFSPHDESPTHALHTNRRPLLTLDTLWSFEHLSCAHRWLTAAVGELSRSALRA
jgi:hypothetical protein